MIASDFLTDTLLETFDLSSPSSYKLPIIPRPGVGFRDHLLHTETLVLVHAITAAVGSYVQLPYGSQKAPLPHSHVPP